MVAFLSPAWFAAVGSPDGTFDGADLVIHQTVTGGPSGDVDYGVGVCGEAVKIVAGPPAHAHIRLEQDYATAFAINAGELAVDDALATGRVRVTGDTRRLVAAGPVLATTGGAVEAMRDASTRA